MEPHPLVLAGMQAEPRTERGRGTRHRLTALGVDAADIVAAVGGLLCDRALAGWYVAAHTDTTQHAQPLRALGAAPAELSALDFAPEAWPDVLVVSSRLFDRRDWVRRYVQVARRHNAAIGWWGQGGRTLPSRLQPVRYRPSRAALVFKERAVRIAGATESESVESLLMREGFTL
ncbi:hypothetical protein [Mycolicibacterium phlei]|jgi:hypothetical protein